MRIYTLRRCNLQHTSLLVPQMVPVTRCDSLCYMVPTIYDRIIAYSIMGTTYQRRHDLFISKVIAPISTDLLY